MDKNAWVVWQGGIKDGRDFISKEAGVLTAGRHGLNAGFENGKRTNPEELIGAVHAGRLSMAQTLGEAGLTAKTIEKHAAVTLNKVGDGYEITISLFRSVPKRPLSLVPPK